MSVRLSASRRARAAASSGAGGFSLIELMFTLALVSIMTVAVLSLFAQLGGYQASTRSDAAIAEAVAAARAAIVNEEACTKELFGTIGAAAPNLDPTNFNPASVASIDLSTGLYGLKGGAPDAATPVLKKNSPLPGQPTNGLKTTGLFLANQRVLSSAPGNEIAEYDLTAVFAEPAGVGAAPRPAIIAPIRISRVSSPGGARCLKLGDGMAPALTAATPAPSPTGSTPCPNGVKTFSLQSPICL